ERAEVAIEVRHVGIDRLRNGGAALAEMQRGRGGDRDLRGCLRVVGEELPMGDLRVAGEAPELFLHARHPLLRLRTALELDLAVAEECLDAVERLQEI